MLSEGLCALLHKWSPLITYSTHILIEFCCVYYSWILICLSSTINVTLHSWINFHKLFFRAVWGSEQNWAEGTEITHTLPASPISHIPHPKHTVSFPISALLLISGVCNLKCFLPLLFTSLTQDFEASDKMSHFLFLVSFLTLPFSHKWSLLML